MRREVGVFSFATASEISFGVGVSREVPTRLATKGQRVLLVTGQKRDRATFLSEGLASQGQRVSSFCVGGEPSVEQLREGLLQARSEGIELVIGMGGGSALDAAKALAILLTHDGDPLDYLELVGAGRNFERAGLPCILLPTTAGTGSEVTRNAVLSSSAHKRKVSMRSAWMLPTWAVVDPTLTCTTPPAVTASTGLDALTQVIEPYVSSKSNPLTDALCQEGIHRIAGSLWRAYQDGNDIEARTDMALGSLCGGLALANAKLGAVHGFAGPIGGMFEIPHGVICARFLPYVMQTNLRALRQRDAQNPILGRYDDVAKWLTGHSGAKAEDGIEWLFSLCEQLRVPSLGGLGLERSAFEELATLAQTASSMKGNPIVLTKEELLALLEQATH